MSFYERSIDKVPTPFKLEVVRDGMESTHNSRRHSRRLNKWGTILSAGLLMLGASVLLKVEAPKPNTTEDITELVLESLGGILSLVGAGGVLGETSLRDRNQLPVDAYFDEDQNPESVT
ncbi:MAG TPA: hypothetical protein VMR34_03405 [Candidatus Saccharimonadales bacterium]|nr:hypothetical protein [Candidatus Saccharimonadales bacterium]